MMAVFRSSSDAVVASLAAQRVLAAEPWPEIGVLRVRMGLQRQEGIDGSRIMKVLQSDRDAGENPP